MKEFLEILSRGKRNLQISFTEEIWKRNPFTGHGFGTENPPKSTKNGATEHKNMTKMTKNNKQKHRDLTTETTLSTALKQYQLFPQNHATNRAHATTTKLFRNSSAFSTRSRHVRDAFEALSQHAAIFRENFVNIFDTLSQDAAMFRNTVATFS